jgi:hypothetical protein
MPRVLVIFFTLIVVSAFATSDRAALIDGVKELPLTGAPGGVSVIGPRAFAVVVGKEGKAKSAVVAATEWEKGRIVAFGHNGYLGLTGEPDAARLLTNAVRWAGRGEKTKVGVRVNNALAEHLSAQGFDVVRLEGVDWLGKIAGLQVICVDAHTLRADRDVSELAKFLRTGGGLLTASTGWGWASLNPGKSLKTDFAGNALLRPAGLVFNERTPDKTARGYAIDDTPLDLLNASHALDALEKHAETPLDAATLAQCGATLSEALQALPADDTLLLPRINSLAQKNGAFVNPTPKEPLKSDQPLARLLVTFTVEQLKRAQPEQIRPHPAALAFPGMVDPGALVENRELTIDTARPGWHSTGLYAAPGALIRISLPADYAGKGYRVRIGCHSDRLWHLEKWQRVPEITTSAKLEAAETKIASAFGGLVYLEVPDKTSGFPLPVTIKGAVGAPYYVLGKTTAADWAKERTKPAPWAELECGRIILTVPSEHIRQLADPEPLAKFWDRVVELQDDLAAAATKRRRPERIVADVQISAGYMHSGYPIMTHLDAAATATDLARMQAGSWGHFHELGHNQQVGDWTFEGTTEVTCNIFSLYISEKLCGKPPGAGHDAMEPARVAKRLAQHLRGEPEKKFDRWKGDAFLALTMYHQLRVGFGWEAYQKVFAEYRDLPRGERPKTDQDKRDQWMVRFSRTVGRNLGPFFEAWGVPVTDGAREQIAGLPVWMPEDWPKL